MVSVYRKAPVWSDLSTFIISDDAKTDYTGENKVVITAQESISALQNAIGADNLGNVVSLQVEGSINSRDIMIIRNKMPNLHYLDLTNVSIVDNSYEYYGGFCSQEGILCGYEFANLTKLISVKLPKSITKIGLSSFMNCASLREIAIPEGVESIDGWAFSHCSSLKEVSFPSTLKYIDGYAFSNSGIETLELPENLESIGLSAFRSCLSIREVVLPASIKYVGEDAFNMCYDIRIVKSKLVDPFSIGQNTFNVWDKATLYVPMTEEWTATYDKYYWDTQWSQFAHIQGWDPTIDNFYIDNDYELDSGTIGGAATLEIPPFKDILDGIEKPDADINPGGGFSVIKNGEQHIKELTVKKDGTKGASVIADADHLTADRLYVEIDCEADRWYFFCFPFDVLRAHIVAPGNFIVREYDGAVRAVNGSGGWRNLDPSDDRLHAGYGYIFQTNAAGTLKLTVEAPVFSYDDKTELKTYVASDKQNASWNFTGNPYLCYYDGAELDYDAPITIWNGFGYEAVTKDDDFLLEPYQAFFVQKTEGKTQVGFSGDGMTTYNKGTEAVAAASRRRAKAPINPERLLVNLTVSSDAYTDKTRVVFNDKCAMDYELECDASKFISAEAPVQLYSINDNVKYAINERPNADRTVQLGFVAKQKGTYTISAGRMDIAMLLRDNVTGRTVDLQLGDYEFTSEAGTFNGRFELLAAEPVEGIETIDLDNITADAVIFDLQGRRVERPAFGTYIVNGKKVNVK